MITMQDYINSTSKSSSILADNIQNKNKPCKNKISVNKEDSFETNKKDTDLKITKKAKINKKMFAVIGIAIAATIAAICAYFKREKIGSFFSDLINNKKKPAAPSSCNSNNTNNISNDIKDKVTNGFAQSTVNSVNSEKNNINIPKPNFGINPTLKERQAYTDSLLEFISNSNSCEKTAQALEQLSQYGTREDLERISSWVWMNADEPMLVKLIQTVGKLGEKDIDDYHIVGYIENEDNKLTNATYIEIFKALSKLVTHYGEKNSGTSYEDLLKFVNRIPSDKDGEYTKTLTQTLIQLGKKEDIDYLDKYLRNFNHVNEFENKNEKTPQVVLDVIETVRKNLSEKK